MKYGLAIGLVCLVGVSWAASQADVLDGVTFASNQDKILVPVRAIAEAMSLKVVYQEGRVYVEDRQLNIDGPTLPNGTRLIPLRNLSSWGVAVHWDDTLGQALLSRGNRQVYVRRGEKKVQVDKGKQQLLALQGNLVVMRTPISSGRRGHRTPNGAFAAGPYKARMHRSSLYDDAPMPYSVQVTGDIFIHGYSTVPDVPASHGCIRLSTGGENPAKFFYEWVEIGTPIEITGRWGR